MKSIFYLQLLLILPLVSVQAQSRPPEGKIHKLPETEAKKTISLNPEYWVFGEDAAANKKDAPLLIVLHGGGGTGLDIKRIKGGAFGPMRTMEKAGMDALVVAPQAARSPMKFGAKGGWVPADLNVLLAHLLTSLPVDPDRVYLTGTSMGGYGTYAWAGVNPEHFAAIAPMVGGLGALGPKDITEDLELWGRNLATLPMRTYYGGQDRVVPPDRGKMILDAVTKAGGTQAELIVFEEMGHDAARRPYSDVDFFEWLFSHRRR